MHKKSIAVAATILTLGLNSAAMASETQVATRTVAVETLVRTNVEDTWNELVSELAGRDYAVNTLERDDRTIQVLFQSTIPSHYVDCGEISVNSQHAQFGNRNYNFLAANSVRYLVADESVDELVDVERRTSLNAVANISLTPIGEGTMMRVEADYAMNFRTREFGRKVVTRQSDDTLNFDSAAGASTHESIRQGASSKAVTIECRAIGKLERDIVSVLGNPS